MVSTAKRRLVMVLTGLVVAFFVVQQVVIEVKGEPFPGVTLPSFAPEITPDLISRRVPLITSEFAEGPPVELTERRLVGPVQGRAFDVLNTLFWIGSREVESDQWEPKDESTVEWSAERLSDLFPSRDATGLTVVWVRRAVRLDGTIDEEKSETVRTVHVDLGDRPATTG